MKEYNPKQIEPKWLKLWEKTGLYRTEEKPDHKAYILDYFPYPSGAGLSVGHVRNYTISDVYPRFRRMRGDSVLHPMGWDGFGLPAENYAIAQKISPRKATDQNKANYKRQMKRMGFSYDWDREVDSTDPAYYKWTQWFFLLLFKRGLAYQKDSEQWWCETDKTVLANEQVKDGRCWRCGNLVTKKRLKQWFFKITDYADRLLDDLKGLDWPEGIKLMQENWIGRSSGVSLKFRVPSSELEIETFTTRVDTLGGATFIVLAPEHPLVGQMTVKSEQFKVKSYLEKVRTESELERLDEERPKTGVFTGSYALNPLNGAKLPIWVADYVLMGYGTGAIMAVPAHDQRDFEFADKFKLPVKRVIKGDELPYEGDGPVVNTKGFDGLSGLEAKKAITEALHRKGVAKSAVNYRLHDWLISRQRYWGAPIPIIHCPKDGPVVVPDEDLPVKLPEIKTYEPSGDGKSPLARVKQFVETKCPKCHGPAERETDTMDGFACSSWYFLRFADPHNETAAFDRQKADYWLPVDVYIGGAEHAVMHLLYARFWTKVMKDAGLIDFNEPFLRLRTQGMILAQDGRKMSKSLNNVITPDEVLDEGYGADALRLFELFIAPYNQEVPWSQQGLAGTDRFVRRVWALVQEYQESGIRNQEGGGSELGTRSSELDTALVSLAHKTIKKVTNDLDNFAFNTAVAALMEFVNGLYKLKVDLPFSNAPEAWRETIQALLKLLAPFTPFVTEELWAGLGWPESIHLQGWPKFDPELVKEELVEIPVQVNGRLRATITVPPDTPEAEQINLAKEQESVKRHLQGKKIERSVVVPSKLINFVTK